MTREIQVFYPPFKAVSGKLIAKRPVLDTFSISKI